MPLLSGFTPCGMLEFSSAPSHAQDIYESLIAAAGGNYSTELGSRFEAKTYAQAMGLGRVYYTIRHVRLQTDPTRLVELLPNVEAGLQIVPTETATMDARRADVARKTTLPAGSSRSALTSVLSRVLGADYLGIYTLPLSLSTSALNYQLPGYAAKLVTLTGAVTTVGSATVGYVKTDASLPTQRVLAGDVLVVETGAPFGISEKVTVTAATSSTFTAVFAKPHSSGALCTTQPWPLENTNSRHTTIIVSSAAAADPEKRRKLNLLLEEVMRGVSTWSIAALSGTGTAGPFTIGSATLGRVGMNPVGTITY